MVFPNITQPPSPIATSDCRVHLLSWHAQVQHSMLMLTLSASLQRMISFCCHIRRALSNVRWPLSWTMVPAPGWSAPPRHSTASCAHCEIEVLNSANVMLRLAPITRPRRDLRDHTSHLDGGMTIVVVLHHLLTTAPENGASLCQVLVRCNQYCICALSLYMSTWNFM
ncbi:hypothetical protein BDN67DRAFT_797688 [Paxillus ammoniavirescens]|nr:hypothetical protein BDN67DRAFT_797688 [Paxillus ammoniavirescens]